MTFDIVIPTIGRSSLCTLLASLDRSSGPMPERIFVVDDRRNASEALDLGAISAQLRERIVLIRTNALGPGSARNAGWRSSRSEWVAFLDDDVVVDESWRADLVHDLAALDVQIAGSQGSVRVPLREDRAPTDWERNVARLQDAPWITADMAYRRTVLDAVGGFDERFRRAYREDADLALRVLEAGYRVARGSRRVAHPVREADPWISVRLQAGNADDVLMNALHGKGWRSRASSTRGRFPRHAATVALAAAGMIALGARARGTALLLFTAWGAMTTKFAWERIAPGPRTAREVRAMLLTSVAIPFAAVFHRARGTALLPRLLRPSP